MTHLQPETDSTGSAGQRPSVAQRTYGVHYGPAQALESVSGLTWKQTQHLSPVDEPRWVDNMKPVRDHWEARAKKPGLRSGQRDYANARVRTIDRSWNERLRACSTRGCFVKCGCPGMQARMYSCRQHWVCETCLHARTRRNAPRIREALEAQWERAIQGSFRSRLVVKITLTTKHTGDLASDQAMIANGWRGLYKRMHRAGWGKFPYVGVWELTPGRDGLGHVHAHLVVIWPFHDWSQVAEWWREACPGSSHIDIRAAENVRQAAQYVSKYLTKGVKDQEFTPEMRADVLAAFYGKKCIFASKKFF